VINTSAKLNIGYLEIEIKSITDPKRILSIKLLMPPPIIRGINMFGVLYSNFRYFRDRKKTKIKSKELKIIIKNLLNVMLKAMPLFACKVNAKKSGIISFFS